MMTDATLLDFFAAAALAGLRASEAGGDALAMGDPGIAARLAYDDAAAMMAERDRRCEK
jgi:hypothetical protein